MNSIRTLAIAATMATFCITGYAQTPVEHDAKHPAAPNENMPMPMGGPDAQMARMDEQIKAMQAMHDKMMAAKTPEERSALMAEQMTIMQDSMTMMGEMGSGGMMGRGGKGAMGGTGSGGMMDQGGTGAIGGPGSGAMMGQGGMGAMKDKPAMGADTSGMPAMQDKGRMNGCTGEQHQMMEKRMQMMQSMMQMMKDSMPPAPGKP